MHIKCVDCNWHVRKLIANDISQHVLLFCWEGLDDGSMGQRQLLWWACHAIGLLCPWIICVLVWFGPRAWFGTEARNFCIYQHGTGSLFVFINMGHEVSFGFVTWELLDTHYNLWARKFVGCWLSFLCLCLGLPVPTTSRMSFQPLIIKCMRAHQAWRLMSFSFAVRNPKPLPPFGKSRAQTVVCLGLM